MIMSMGNQNMSTRGIKSDIDFHAHILPGCDHGSKNLQESLEQLDLAWDAGVGIVCATPHFYPQRESLSDFLMRRSRCWEKLCPNLSSERPQVRLGAEVLICSGMERMDGIEKLCLEGTNLLLLEMPFTRWSKNVKETALAIADRKDVQVVLAHIDRYDAEDVYELMSEGIKAQINVENLCRQLKGHQLRNMITRGEVFAVGSDIHGTETGYRSWIKSKKLLKHDWDSLMVQLGSKIAGN